MKRKLVCLLLSAAIIAIMLGACASPTPTTAPKPTLMPTPTPTAAPTPAPKAIVLTMTSSAPEASSLSLGLKTWAAALEKLTGGRAKVGQMTWGGALLKTADVNQGLGRGVVDVAMASPNYAPSLFALSYALNPSFINDGAGQSVIMRELYNTTPELQTEWQKANIHLLYLADSLDAVLGTNFLVKSPKDLVAKRIRSSSACDKAMANLGAIPISMPSGDIAEGLSKGTIDGFTGLPAYSLKGYGFEEYMKQVINIRKGGNSPWLGAGMNLDTYKSLPEDVKKVLPEAGKIAAEAVNKDMIDTGIAGLKLARDKGAVITQLTEQEAAEWLKLINPPSVWEKDIATAEKAGYKNVREIFSRLVAQVEKWEKENPHPTLFELFYQKYGR